MKMIPFLNKYSIIWGLVLLPFLMTGQAEITVNTSASIDKMMDYFITNGKSTENITAWRVQLITTDDRRNMEQNMALFKSMYPGVNIDWKHISPYYQVRVGYFETRNKLMPFLLELKKTFPAATPVYDSVSKRALVNN
ncbi:MAG: hypothetical protein J5I52_05235 [Saprospiraceae bacterium]|nr:hypothetical protein [Saprospiraceae bacterium]MCZ2340035.1 hypothetical protein [Chitinophagales bacterium]